MYCVAEPGILLKICNTVCTVCLNSCGTYIRGWGGGRGGQPPDQLLISYILCDSSFQPNEGVRLYVLKIMILLLLFLGVLCIVYCVAEPVMLLQICNMYV